jgi:hypothetical protein
MRYLTVLIVLALALSALSALGTGVALAKKQCSAECQAHKAAKEKAASEAATAKYGEQREAAIEKYDEAVKAAEEKYDCTAEEESECGISAKDELKLKEAKLKALGAKKATLEKDKTKYRLKLEKIKKKYGPSVAGPSRAR